MFRKGSPRVICGAVGGRGEEVLFFFLHRQNFSPRKAASGTAASILQCWFFNCVFSICSHAFGLGRGSGAFVWFLGAAARASWREKALRAGPPPRDVMNVSIPHIGAFAFGTTSQWMALAGDGCRPLALICRCVRLFPNGGGARGFFPAAAVK